MAVDDAYTVSLLHFQNRVWTFAGTAQIDTAQKPFATGGSLLLDGDSDYMTTPDSVDFDFGAGDFTVDFWIKRAATGNCYLVNHGDMKLLVEVYNNKIYFTCWDGATAYEALTAVSFTDTASWHHLAFVRDGNTNRIFVDGVPDGTKDVTGATFSSGTGVLSVGAKIEGSYPVNGWVGEFRITKGLARWTADFSASLPTAKYTDDANTVSLLHFDEDDGAVFTKDVAANWTMDAAPQFYDESGKVWTAAGNAQLDTAQYKWTASGLFDGNGDYISTPHHADFNLGSGDFTIDFWVKSTQTTQYATLVCKTPASFSTGMWSLMTSRTSAGDVAFFANEYSSGSPLLLTAGSLFNTDSWVHVALVRYGNVWTLYIGGTSAATRTTETTISDLSAAIYAGADQHYGRNFNGWIDEVRISKGIARWTENFTLPTVEYSLVVEYTPPTITTVDTFNAPSINTMFIPTIATVDTFNAPTFGWAIPIPTIATVDTFNAPTYTNVMKFIIPTIYTNDVFNAPTATIPVRRKRVKVNW